MDIGVLLILQLVISTLTSILAFASTVYIVWHIISQERKRVKDAENHAFDLYDAILQSFIPRTLGDKLSQVFRIEHNPSAMTDNRAVAASLQTTPATNMPALSPSGTETVEKK